MIRGVHHTAISTPDLERLLGFYRDLVGFDEAVLDYEWDATNEAAPLIMEAPPTEARSVLLRAGNTFLELFEFRDPPPRARAGDWSVIDHGLTHICLDVDDVDAEYERLSAAGMRFHCPPRSVGAGIRTTYGRDPDGNIVEVQQIPAGGHRCGLPGT
jgi:catechol 2,3-dioxygenase-like lactoylglutathione lyase family enzyme